MKRNNFIEIGENNLSIKMIHDVASLNKMVRIKNTVKNKMDSSCKLLEEFILAGKKIYGVTTNFGGMANHIVNRENEALLQEQLLLGLRCATGKKLPVELVRAGMLIHANAIAKGASAIRYEFASRICKFLNAGMTPIVYELGSIGASGDLIPLSYIAGAIIGLDDNYKVNYQKKEISAIDALNLLELKPIKLQAKEGLALINGTSMMTGIAAICIKEAKRLFELSLAVHAFFITALQCNIEAFDDFVHMQKPHIGQKKVAKKILELISGSQLTQLQNNEKLNSKGLWHDRYSIRCLPQYLGVITDGLETINQQIMVEANSVTDNPIIDTQNKKILHSGNFLGQYVSVGMDQLRYYLGLLAKHLDTQIALLVTPEFNHGLPGSLNANQESSIKFGLKGLQICANSIVPLLLQLGQGIVPFFPTHAEQFNQNINSQGYSSALLAYQSTDLMRRYLAISLIFAVQAIELRCYQAYKNYNVINYLTPHLSSLYKTVQETVGQNNSSTLSVFINDFSQQVLDKYIKLLIKDLESAESKILKILDKSI